MPKSKNPDGEPLIGRFIKHTDHRILRSLSVSDFSFQDICRVPFSLSDNANRNILRSQLHYPDELASTVQNHETIDDDLRKDMRRPILRPLDFTDDWERQKARASARRMQNLDEDEVLELELEDMVAPGGVPLERSEPAQVDSVPSSDESSLPIEHQVHRSDSEEQQGLSDLADPATLAADRNSETGEAMTEALSEASKASDPNQDHSEQASLMDEVGREIRKVAPDVKDLDGAAMGTPAVAAGEFASDPMEASSESAIPDHDTETMTNDREVEPASDGFTPLVEQPQAELQPEVNDEAPEEPSIDTVNEAEVAALKTTISNLQNMAAEVHALKGDILRETQQNFIEIAHAVAESVLRRELKINPDALRTVIQEAIDENFPQEDVRIAVHPEFLAAMQAQVGEVTPLRFSGDDALQPGDFRIESPQRVVDGNLSKSIADLIAGSDLEILTQTDDEDSEPMAG